MILKPENFISLLIINKKFYVKITFYIGSWKNWYYYENLKTLKGEQFLNLDCYKNFSILNFCISAICGGQKINESKNYSKILYLLGHLQTNYI